MTDNIAASRRSQIMLRAARLYYVQNRTMDAIAAELHISRSSVSRLLARARATGMVEIRLHPTPEGSATLANDLAERYGVSAQVVPVATAVSDVDRLDRVARAAGRMLGRYVDSNMTIGIAWGSTMSAVSRHLSPRATRNAVVVQMNGAGNVLTTGIDYANEILHRFGTAYSAEVQEFPVPAFLDAPATREALWRERSTRRVLDIQSRMDVAVFGVGSPFSEVPSRVHIGGYLDDADYRSLREDHVVGDIGTMFYRSDGSYSGVRLNRRATGFDFTRLGRVPRRVAVVAGAQKTHSVRGALAAGLITDLILDEELARSLLD